MPDMMQDKCFFLSVLRIIDTLEKTQQMKRRNMWEDCKFSSLLYIRNAVVENVRVDMLEAKEETSIKARD